MKHFRFDWAIKKILRDKANFVILEGFLTELIWVFDTSPQFIRGRVRMQNYCAERLAE